MRLIQRMELHNALRRMSHDDELDKGDRTAVAKVLAHDEALAVLETRVERSAIRAGATAGPLQNFLDWLIANQAAIIAFIKAILAMFGM